MNLEFAPASQKFEDLKALEIRILAACWNYCEPKILSLICRNIISKIPLPQ